MAREQQIRGFGRKRSLVLRAQGSSWQFLNKIDILGPSSFHMSSLEIVRVQKVFHPDPFPWCCLEFLGFLCGKILGSCIAFRSCAFERFALLYLSAHTHTHTHTQANTVRVTNISKELVLKKETLQTIATYKEWQNKEKVLVFVMVMVMVMEKTK